ncbi:iron dicitrate transport regulator FecR, partial [Xanthomonas sp. Kuri4-2]
MALPQDTETLMFREAAETADVVAAQFARNHATITALAASLRAAPP